MVFLFNEPGSPLISGFGSRVLTSALPASLGAIPSEFLGPYPSNIAGLSGWWDAGLISGLRDTNDLPLVASNNSVSCISDKSGNGTLLQPYCPLNGITPTATTAVPRVNGLLGAVGGPTPGIASYGPTLDPEWGLVHPGLEFGSGLPWTRYFVWTRPNWRQGTIYGNAHPIPLIHTMIGNGLTLLQADSSEGSTLTLFPGTSAQTIVTSALARRHSHAIILRNTPGQGVDVWLDGEQLASAVPNPLPANALAQTLLLHDGTIQGSAQCWFHEAACWERALEGDEISILIAAQGRWVLGTRKGLNLLVMGQSNAAWFINSGGALALAQGAAWYLGAAAYGYTAAISGTYLSPDRYSVIAGHPISNSSPPAFPPGIANGTFLTNPGDGSDPTGWSGGPDFAALTNYLTGNTAVVSEIDQTDIAFLVWPWSEQDSTMPYTSKELYKGSVLRLLSLSRELFGRTEMMLPMLAWSAIPYAGDTGIQMVRESIADLAADPANYIHFFVKQTADSNPLNSDYDATNGSFLGGDPNHRDQIDLLRYGRIGAHAAGQLAVKMGLSDTIPAHQLPFTGLPMQGGPRISHVFRATDTELILTISHDSGNDLIVPLQAMNGAGFAVMDGGSVAEPGKIISGIKSERVDATHISITLAEAIISPSSSAVLFYPYGSTQIGRGDAVTDNASVLSPPLNWNIGQDLGSAWSMNFPLQATCYPIVLSDTPI